jgi:hypothetical protein
MQLVIKWKLKIVSFQRYISIMPYSLNKGAV